MECLHAGVPHGIRAVPAGDEGMDRAGTYWEPSTVTGSHETETLSSEDLASRGKDDYQVSSLQ